MHNPAGKMSSHALLPKWLEWSYFAVAVILLVSYGALHKDGFNKTLLVDCISHSTFCRMDRHLHNAVWRTLCFAYSWT